jgi:hypothetical protein
VDFEPHLGDYQGSAAHYHGESNTSSYDSYSLSGDSEGSKSEEDDDDEEEGDDEEEEEEADDDDGGSTSNYKNSPGSRIDDELEYNDPGEPDHGK